MSVITEEPPSLLPPGTHIAVSIVLNWIVGPFLMLGLAWATLPDLPTYRTGIIIVGIARCIAMVNIWTSLAKGDCDVCAILVIVNSALQMVLFSPYSLLLINVISDGHSLALDYQHVAIAVAMYLGVPLAAGILTRFLGFTIMGKDRFKKSFLPYFGPLSLLALLYVIIVIFALQARHVLDNLGPTFRCFVPLIIYFIIMWSGTFAACYWLSIRRAGKSAQTWDYSMSVVQSFTAVSTCTAWLLLMGHELTRPSSTLRTSSTSQSPGLEQLRTSYRHQYLRVWSKFRSSLGCYHRAIGRDPRAARPDLLVSISRSKASLGREVGSGETKKIGRGPWSRC